MRIAIAQRLTLAHGVRGGMETQAHSLASGLAARGHEIVVFSTPLRGDATRTGSEDGIPVRYIAPGTYRGYPPRWWHACYTDLRRLHQQQRFDAILSHSAGALGYMAVARRELAIPATVVLHGTPLGDLRTRLQARPSPREAYRLARTLAGTPGLLLRWRDLVRRAEPNWLALTPLLAHEWHQQTGARAERITIVPNGVDTERFRPDPVAGAVFRAAHGIAAEVPLLLASGRLEYEKGFHVALAAFAQIRSRQPTTRLVLVGDGRQRTALMAQAAALGGGVIFTGYLPNAQLPAALAAADLFLMPTLCHEGLPMTIIEALACGVPVIASRMGGIPYAVDDGVTGTLVPPADAAVLAAAASALLVDPRRRHAMRALARQVASARLSRPAMVEATERVLLGRV